MRNIGSTKSIQRKTIAIAAFIYIIFTRGFGAATNVPACPMGKSMSMEVQALYIKGSILWTPNTNERTNWLTYTIVRTSNRHVQYKRQYAVQFKLPNGDVIVRRLKGKFPTTADSRIDDELPEFRMDCERAALDIYRELIECGDTIAPKQARGLTCRQSMEQYKVWHKANRKCNHKTFDYSCRFFLIHFDGKRLALLDRAQAEGFVEAMISRTPKLSYNTVRLAVMAASGMIEYYRNKGMWDRPNPFSRIMLKYAWAFPAMNPGPTCFTESEWKSIYSTARANTLTQASIFMEVAATTGLRPSEIYRLDTRNIDRASNDWRILVTKRSGQPTYRTIPVPQELVRSLDNLGVIGVLPITEISVRRQLRSISSTTGIRIYPKRFRKDFSVRMERSGAGGHLINLMQGRGQTGVLYKHYLGGDSREASVCRPYIEQMYKDFKSTTSQYSESNIDTMTDVCGSTESPESNKEVHNGKQKTSTQKENYQNNG